MDAEKDLRAKKELKRKLYKAIYKHVDNKHMRMELFEDMKDMEEFDGT